MPNIVVVGGFVECSHGGKSKIKSGNAKLKISGAEAVTMGMEVGLSFLPANATPTPDNPAVCTRLADAGSPPPPSPCSGTMAATVGISTKIKVDGVGVLLDTASGTATNRNDLDAKWKISDAGQTIMKEV